MTWEGAAGCRVHFSPRTESFEISRDSLAGTNTGRFIGRFFAIVNVLIISTSFSDTASVFRGQWIRIQTCHNFCKKRKKRKIHV